MATFKVGQRVKVIGQEKESIRIWGNIIGCEGIITALAHPMPRHYTVVLLNGKVWGIAPWHLAPLTDPGFDAFMQRVMKPINEPITVNV